MNKKNIYTPVGLWAAADYGALGPAGEQWTFYLQCYVKLAYTCNMKNNKELRPYIHGEKYNLERKL